ncbi:hypothetical protein DACRYDRAFT_21456 [Dacryopinax primogenitus]|uniref:Uncharacterized protein n=1 Tax=Dacryopinax primogenitus (strain DJM 731) TaxID=1858805 RepID=M5GEF2_DACPD|nr:uncharacterized protein DACRYDRAFT_21456 [Dacryopinax primogenitus]EJU03188.1 hypothetical protein DACRYDRAFT_21456 [Dacryopinax primogenitus]
MGLPELLAPRAPKNSTTLSSQSYRCPNPAEHPPVSISDCISPTTTSPPGADRRVNHQRESHKG